MTSPETGGVQGLYRQLAIELHTGAGPEAAAHCFAAPEDHAHGDLHPSTSVNLESGAWICHACGARGGAYDAARAQGHTPRSAMALLVTNGLARPRHPGHPPAPETIEAPARVRRSSRLAPRQVTTRQVDTFHEQLLDQPQLVDRLGAERGITAATITTFSIGVDRDRITIPVTDPAGRLAGLLRWKPFDRGTGAKMLAAAGTRRDLFPPPETITANRIVICEGEPDALTAHSAGITAVAIPGVASWRHPWAARFTGHTVTVALDCDFAGRQCAERVLYDLTAAGILARVVDLAPARSDGYDLTDHLLTRSGTPVFS